MVPDAAIYAALRKMSEADLWETYRTCRAGADALISPDGEAIAPEAAFDAAAEYELASQLMAVAEIAWLALAERQRRGETRHQYEAA